MLAPGATSASRERPFAWRNRRSGYVVPIGKAGGGLALSEPRSGSLRAPSSRRGRSHATATATARPRVVQRPSGSALHHRAHAMASPRSRPPAPKIRCRCFRSPWAGSGARKTDCRTDRWQSASCPSCRQRQARRRPPTISTREMRGRRSDLKEPLIGAPDKQRNGYALSKNRFRLSIPCVARQNDVPREYRLTMPQGNACHATKAPPPSPGAAPWFHTNLLMGLPGHSARA